MEAAEQFVERSDPGCESGNGAAGLRALGEAVHLVVDRIAEKPLSASDGVRAELEDQLLGAFDQLVGP